jgi:antitoxin component YwqK of YwqJK toxin-antitoxin module
MKNIVKILILLSSLNLGSCNKSIDSKSENETISEEIVIPFDKEKQNFSEIEGILFYKGNPLTGKVMRNLKITICCDELKRRKVIEERALQEKRGIFETPAYYAIDGMYDVIVQEIITYKYGKKEGESSTSFEFDEFWGRVILMEGIYKDGKKNGKWKDYGFHSTGWEGNYVGGEGNYLNGEKVGEWKYYFEPWFGLGDVFHSEFYETRLDSIP